MNKKLTKVLSVFLIAGALGAGVAGATGCTHKHTYDTSKWVVSEEDATKHGNPSTCKHQGLTKNDEDHKDTNGDGKCDKCGVDVKAPDDKPNPDDGDTTVKVTEVKVTSKDNATGLKVDETLQLTATVTATPDEAANKEVTWASSDDSKATVSATGLVTGVAAGDVTITATSKKDNTKKDTITLTVSAKTQSGEQEGPGGEDEKYELVETVFDFKDAYDTQDTDSLDEKGRIPSPRTIGKFTFATGTKFESADVNTQGKDITIVLGGITNSISFSGEGASSSKDTEYTLLKGETDVTPSGWESTANKAKKDFTAENLAAGTYTLKTSASSKITNLKLVEKLEKSEATGIVVKPDTIDFLVGEEFSAGNLNVTLNYSNGRKDTLYPNNYDVAIEEGYNKDVAGKYAVTVTYKNNTNFKDTYYVYVYSIDSIKVQTLGVDSNGPTALQQAVVTNGTLSKNYLTVNGTGTIGEGDAARTHTFVLPEKALNVELPLTSSEGEQEANITVNTAYTTGGKSLTGNYKVMVKNAITDVTDNKVELTVGATGSDFKTLTQAVQYLGQCDLAAGVNKIIKIAAGKYEEKVRIDVDNVTLIGQGTTADDTEITYSLVEGDATPTGALWGLNCATVHVTGKNFKAYKVAIRNDFDYIHNASKYTSGSQTSQGLALTLDGDGAVLSNCHLYGNQDTLFMKSGRSFYYETQIDGNVDFIFGNETGLAYFQECKILAVNRTEVAEGQKGGEQNGYVTAAKHNDVSYGYIFKDCLLTDDGKVKDGAMSLGRSWGTKASVAYISCSFSAAYSKLSSAAEGKDHRWSDWSGGTKAENADFWEYESAGEGALTELPEGFKGGKILTAEQAANYTKTNLFGQVNCIKAGYKNDEYTTFDCDGILTALHALASGQTIAEYTVTIKDTEGNSLGTDTYTEGQTLSADAIKSYVNNLESIKTAEKEVNKVYSAYTDATTNTELVDGLITEDCEIIVSLKDTDEKIYDLLDYEGNPLEQGKEYETGEHKGIIIDTTTGGKFSSRPANSDIQINAGTILKIPMADRYKVSIYYRTKGYLEASSTTFTVEYVTEDEQLYAKVVFKSQFYAQNIKIDKTTQMPATAYYQVTFDLDYTDATNGNPVQVIGGYTATKPADPTRAGWTFVHWYDAEDVNEAEFDFTQPITGNVTLKAKWSSGETVAEPILIEAAKDFNFGKLGTNTMYTTPVTNQKKCIDELCIDGTFEQNGAGSDWYKISANTSIQIKVAAGLEVQITVLQADSKYSVKLGDQDATINVTDGAGASGNPAIIIGQQSSETVITFTATSSFYIGAIRVVTPA